MFNANDHVNSVINLNERWLTPGVLQACPWSVFKKYSTCSSFSLFIIEELSPNLHTCNDVLHAWLASNKGQSKELYLRQTVLSSYLMALLIYVFLLLFWLCYVRGIGSLLIWPAKMGLDLMAWIIWRKTSSHHAETWDQGCGHVDMVCKRDRLARKQNSNPHF